MEDFKMDPRKLSRPVVVAQASAAIQKAAQGLGVMIGPVRELSGRPANRELASLQLEAVGPLPSLFEIPARDAEPGLSPGHRVAASGLGCE